MVLLCFGPFWILILNFKFYFPSPPFSTAMSDPAASAAAPPATAAPAAEPAAEPTEEAPKKRPGRQRTTSDKKPGGFEWSLSGVGGS